MPACRVKKAVIINEFNQLSTLLIHKIRIKCNCFTNSYERNYADLCMDNNRS